MAAKKACLFEETNRGSKSCAKRLEIACSEVKAATVRMEAMLKKRAKKREEEEIRERKRTEERERVRREREERKGIRREREESREERE